MIAGTVSAFLLLAFLGGCVWLFAVRRASDFDRMARIPLDENAEEARP